MICCAGGMAVIKAGESRLQGIMKKTEKCIENQPDCFNCPYDDCVATYKDIVRQDKYRDHKAVEERNEKVVSLWNEGMTQALIAEKLALNATTVQSIISIERRKGRMHVRRSQKESAG